MTPPDIAHMSVKERLDLIADLWDSLAAESVDLTAEQEAELARRMTAVDLAHDDLVWAKPYVDEAIAEVERGDVMTLDDVEAHLATRFGPIAG